MTRNRHTSVTDTYEVMCDASGRGARAPLGARGARGASGARGAGVRPGARRSNNPEAWWARAPRMAGALREAAAGGARPAGGGP
jgi:hypothetical protein